jgi:PhoH-like ATPase
MTTSTAVSVVEQRRRVYVLDTNVLLADPDSLEAFRGHDVVVPMAVLEELDRQKTRHDDVGRSARQVSRTLDRMRAGSSLLRGVPLTGGGTLRIMTTPVDLDGVLPIELQEAGKVDNYLVALVLKLGSDNSVEPVMVSKDINVRLKCDALGIKCEDYKHTRIVDDPAKFYNGVVVLDAPLQLIDAVHAGPVTLTDLTAAGLVVVRQPLPNQIVVLRHVQGEQKRSAVTRCVAGSLHRVPDRQAVFGLRPRNKEQLFALDLLMDPKVCLVTLVGPSGTGKTLLSLAAGLAQMHGMGSTAPSYDRLIVTRPVQPVGRDLGFLPGTLHEKMEPWVAPIRDNLEQLMGAGRPQGLHRAAAHTRARRGHDVHADSESSYLSCLMERGQVEIEAITFIRGRSIPRAFIVIDEAQNLTLHELKTIITRAGEGTKIVLTGDIEQIDRPDVDIYTNGLTFAAERFKSHAIAGHITLVRGERSELATLASQIL